MGEKNGSSALTRIEQFKDNETEQVWELFKNEFRDASRQLDGELGWMLVSGGLGIEDVNKQMPKEIVTRVFGCACAEPEARLLEGRTTIRP